MHVIQWAYPACDRHPAWVEGTAAWAEDFVYKGDQGEHGYQNGLLFPYSSMLDAGTTDYQAWPFWYSVAKQGGAAAIKTFMEALAGSDFAGALAGLPGGLREAWKRYAVQRWNQAPIGSAGFSVSEAFKQWDSFGTTPARGPDTSVLLGGQEERTLDLKTYGPGGLGDPSKDLAPLSTSFTRVTIDDANVRELRLTNALDGVPGTAVQAFLRLKNGNWRLEDWSDEGEVTLCRDEADQDVTELIVASSNALATGGPLGRATHQLRARSHCEQPPIIGTFSGHSTYDDTVTRVNWSWNGTVELEANGQANGWKDYESEVWDNYTVKSGSVTISGSGTTVDCTLDIPGASHSLGPNGSRMLIQPGPEPHYGIELVPSEVAIPGTYTCPDQDPFDGFVAAPILIYTPDAKQTMTRGTYQGTSSFTGGSPPGTIDATFNWSLSQAEP
jgi:hypothetical protein